MRKLDCTGTDLCMSVAYVGNVFTKMMVFKDVGAVMEGHSHVYDHVTLIASGKVAITSNGRTTEFEGPHLVVIPKGVTHRIRALEPWTVAVCIHAVHSKESPEDILDVSMLPEGTPPWSFAALLTEGEVLVEERSARKTKVTVLA